MVCIKCISQNSYPTSCLMTVGLWWWCKMMWISNGEQLQSLSCYPAVWEFKICTFYHILFPYGRKAIVRSGTVCGSWSFRSYSAFPFLSSTVPNYTGLSAGEYFQTVQVFVCLFLFQVKVILERWRIYYNFQKVSVTSRMSLCSLCRRPWFSSCPTLSSLGGSC